MEEAIKDRDQTEDYPLSRVGSIPGAVSTRWNAKREAQASGELEVVVEVGDSKLYVRGYEGSRS